jgi:hypothetical protein
VQTVCWGFSAVKNHQHIKGQECTSLALLLALFDEFFENIAELKILQRIE